MILSEDEASKKWCPHVRFHIFTTRIEARASANRVGSDAGEDLNPRQSRCIASACMMWRWHDERGYCGLAGEVL